MLLAKYKLNAVEVLFSKALINSNIKKKNVVINNVVNIYDDTKEEIKNPNNTK